MDQHEIKFRAWDSENVEIVEKLVREKQSLEKLVILCLHEMGKLEVGDDLLRCIAWDDWEIAVSRDLSKLTTIWGLKKQDKEGE